MQRTIRTPHGEPVLTALKRRALLPLALLLVFLRPPTRNPTGPGLGEDPCLHTGPPGPQPLPQGDGRDGFASTAADLGCHGQPFLSLSRHYFLKAMAY